MIKFFSSKELKKILFITGFKKLRFHELKHWIFVLLYAFIYFTIETLTKKYNIEFYVWDTALTAFLILLALFIGNLFCGWACFLWRFQDVADIVGRFFLRSKYNKIIPLKLKNKLRWVRFFVMGITIILPLIFGSYNIFLSLWGFGLMAGLVISLIDSHAYCKYFCMNGAMFKLASLLNKKVLIRDKVKCIDCNICNEVCLHDCTPGNKEKVINRDLWCTSCFRCKTVCPTNAISYK